MTADIDAVVRSAKLSRFALLGQTLTSGAAVAFAVQNPEQVARLILVRPVILGTDVMPKEVLQGLVMMIRSNWQMGSQAVSDFGGQGVDPTRRIRAAEMLRQNTDAASLATTMTDLYETIDVREALRDVKCPTLILHRKEDVVPLGPIQQAAATIPGARLILLPGIGNPSMGESIEDATHAVAAFLDEDAETRALTAASRVLASDSAFRAVLFTDLVGHTEMMSRLGDEKGRDVLREHERITREVLKANGGTEMKTMGDGFMASFASVTKAVECAVALQRKFEERSEKSEVEPLSVRVGLNAGEPIEEDGDLFGATVILASRIAGKAEGGEILVADTVRGLCSGKGFLFSDRGEFKAKGIEEPVRVYEVGWRG